MSALEHIAQIVSQTQVVLSFPKLRVSFTRKVPKSGMQSLEDCIFAGLPSTAGLTANDFDHVYDTGTLYLLITIITNHNKPTYLQPHIYSPQAKQGFSGLRKYQFTPSTYPSFHTLRPKVLT